MRPMEKKHCATYPYFFSFTFPPPRPCLKRAPLGDGVDVERHPNRVVGLALPTVTPAIVRKGRQSPSVGRTRTCRRGPSRRNAAQDPRGACPAAHMAACRRAISASLKSVHSPCPRNSTSGGYLAYRRAAPPASGTPTVRVSVDGWSVNERPGAKKARSVVPACAGVSSAKRPREISRMCCSMAASIF